MLKVLNEIYLNVILNIDLCLIDWRQISWSMSVYYLLLLTAELGFGDIVQPGLTQLQPYLDETMDTLAPLSGVSGK